MQDTSRLAQALRATHRNAETFHTLHLDGQPMSIAQGYAVQDAYVALLLAEQGDAGIAGYKIGLTSAAMQTMCGIASPIHGRIPRAVVHASGASIDLSRYGRLGVEFEVAVRLGADLPGGTQAIDEVARHVDAVCPALELIDDRAADYATLDAASLIADNSWNAGIVLGPWQPLPADLAHRRGRVSQGGAPVDEGTVGAALDHPLASVGWLAGELARMGRVLEAGMVVMTGSIVRTRFPAPGERWHYEIDGLGMVEAAFERGAPSRS